MATYDIALFQPPATTGSTYDQALLADGLPGRSVTGSEKLAQRFLFVLMTPKGSVAYRPRWGTGFTDALRSRNFLSELDLFAAFASALLEAGTSLAEDETSDDPDEERYRSAQILQVTLAESTSAVKILVKNRTGTSGLITLPVSFG